MYGAEKSNNLYNSDTVRSIGLSCARYGDQNTPDCRISLSTGAASFAKQNHSDVYGKNTKR